ncbi:MAG: chorismate synthase [Bacteroidota bacterium]
MASNSIGKNLQITSFGESHGPAVGVVIDGFPANFTLDLLALQACLDRRRPGQSDMTTARNESDHAQILSGVYEGKTLGSPITILIQNADAQSKDYDALKDVYRPGHADWLYKEKYGHRDHRGGGRSSARITAGWVAAGALAMQYLNARGISVTAWVNQVWTIQAPDTNTLPNQTWINGNSVRCWHEETANRMIAAISEAKIQGDSLGGAIRCVVDGMPAGVGEPVFGKLQAILGLYLLNINAVKGIAFGDGFAASKMRGSEHNDAWKMENGAIVGATNHSGGIVGGMSTGNPIQLDLAFKPTSTIAIAQQTIDAEGNSVTLNATGRHDPCVLPRAVPIVEAMTALAIMDLLLETK